MENHADILNDCEAPSSASVCQKDVGERYKLHSWSIEDTSLLFEHVATLKHLGHYFSNTSSMATLGYKHERMSRGYFEPCPCSGVTETDLN